MGSHTVPQRVATSALSVAMMISGLTAAGIAATSASAAPKANAVQDESFTVRGDDILAAAKLKNGLTFKGFGALSGNNSSELLMDYKAEHPEEYWQLIKTLFGGSNPMFTHVKVEMGNDRNTSSGANAATMRSADEYPNVKRDPGFQLAADAKKVNPDVHVSILRWRVPAWVTSNDDVYHWYKNTILAVNREFGYMIDSVNPGVNEEGADLEWTKEFAKRLKSDTEGFIVSEGETDPDGDPIPAWKDDAERDAFHKIDINISDEYVKPTFGNAMVSDSELRDLVDISSWHYYASDDAKGNFKKLATQYDEQVWNSEGQATLSNTADRPNNNVEGADSGIGGNYSALEMANTAIKGFAKSNRTHFIYQPAIASYYEGVQFGYKEVVSARDPWSGWMYYDGATSVLEHFQQFAKTGWENDSNTAGIWRAIPGASASDVTGENPVKGARNGEKSYITLAAPDASDFSSVIVNDSKYTKRYTIKTEGLNLGDDATMEIWQTKAADANSGQAYDANYKQLREEIQPNADGTYTVEVEPWSIVTATTLDKGGVTAKDGRIDTDVPRTAENSRAVLDTDATGAKQGVTGDTTLYADDFEYSDGKYQDVKTLDPATGKLVSSGDSYLDSRGGDTGAAPRYADDTNGALEVVKTEDGNHVLRQQVGPGMQSNDWQYYDSTENKRWEPYSGAWQDSDPTTWIGDSRWANYRVSVDVSFEDYDSTGSVPYAMVGARQFGGTASGADTAAYELRVFADGSWKLRRYGKDVQSGTLGSGFKPGSKVTNRIALQVAGDTVTAYVNDETASFLTFTDSVPQTSGRVQLGSSFNFVRFDNLKVETVAGYTPYYVDSIDNMHMTSWDDNSKRVLEYTGDWSQTVGSSWHEVQRSKSTTKTKGSALTVTFAGTGLDLVGANTGAVSLNVMVDGKLIAAKASTKASEQFTTTYSLRGLSDGTHTVTFETANDGTLVIDSVGVIVPNVVGSADITALRASVDAAKQVSKPTDEGKAELWDVLSNNLAIAEEVVKDGAKADQEGVDALAARLDDARLSLTEGPVSSDVADLGMLNAVSDVAQLPETLTVNGTTVSFDDINWDVDPVKAIGDADPARFDTVTLTGVTKHGVNGVRQRVSVKVIVALEDLRYFIDSGASTTAQPSAYSSVRALNPDLLNDAADAQWDGSASGATWGYSTESTVAPVSGDATDWGSSYVGAHYNKPIVYHLTLPAGEYTIGGVHTARAAKFYMTVTDAAGNELAARQTGASGTTTASLTAAVKLNERTLVNVEFGTDGTSGNNARLALLWVRSAADKTTLNAAIAAANALDEADYTPETWAPFAEALRAAQSVADTDQVFQRNVDDAVFALLKAQSGLVAESPVPEVRRDVLDAAIDAASKLVDEESKFTTESWNPFADALAKAQKVEADANATQQDVDEAAKQLVAAQANLVLRETISQADKTSLKALVDAASSIKSEGYTQESWATFSAALQAAQKVIDDANATQQSVNAAFNALAQALSKLTVEHADTPEPEPTNRAVLDAAIAAANKLIDAKDEYTPESWNAFIKALDAAKSLAADAGQVAVNQAASALIEAQSNLVRVDGDKPQTPEEKPDVKPTIDLSVLKDAIAAAEKVEDRTYTAESWSTFVQSLNAARELLKNSKATQEQIDQAAKALDAAREGLVVEESETPVDPRPETPGTQESPNPQPSDDGSVQEHPGSVQEHPGSENGTETGASHNKPLASTGANATVAIASAVVLCVVGALAFGLSRRRNG